MPLLEGSEPSPYGDTAVPKRLGTVIPLDPQLFSTVEEYTAELLNGHSSGRYSPIEVAQSLEDMTDSAERALSSAAGRAGKPVSANLRRLQEDVLIEIGLGRFFAAQIRSAALFDIYKQTGDPAALDRAIEYYRKAREAWANMAQRASKVYRADLTFGDMPVRRGHWRDHVPGIDRDLAAMEKLKMAGSAPAKKSDAGVYIHKAVGQPERRILDLRHSAPPSFHPGSPLQISFVLPTSGQVSSGRLHYRHVNHAERWNIIDMALDAKKLSTTIPADYTKTDFALQYYIELHFAGEIASLFPGLDLKRGNQPYFVVPQST